MKCDKLMIDLFLALRPEADERYQGIIRRLAVLAGLDHFGSVVLFGGAAPIERRPFAEAKALGYVAVKRGAVIGSEVRWPGGKNRSSIGLQHRIAFDVDRQWSSFPQRSCTAKPISTAAAAVNLPSEG